MTTAAVSTATTAEIEMAASPATKGPPPTGTSGSALAASLALPRRAASADPGRPGSAKPAHSGPSGGKTARSHAKSDVSGPEKQGAGTVFAGVLAALAATGGTATPASGRNRGADVATSTGVARPGQPGGSTSTYLLAAQPGVSAGPPGQTATAQAGGPRSQTASAKPRGGGNQAQAIGATQADLEVRVQGAPASPEAPTAAPATSASAHLPLGPPKGDLTPTPAADSLAARDPARSVSPGATPQPTGQGATETERLAAATGAGTTSASTKMATTGIAASAHAVGNQTGAGHLGAGHLGAGHLGAGHLAATTSSPVATKATAAGATAAGATAAGATAAGATAAGAKAGASATGNAVQPLSTPGTSHGAGAIQGAANHYDAQADQKGGSSTSDSGAGTTNGTLSQPTTAGGSAPDRVSSAAQAAAGATTAFVAPPASGAGVHTTTLTHPAANTAQQPKPEPLPTQLATVLAPAAHQPDGSYQVSIRLQPEELGTVDVALHLVNGTLSVSLHAEGDATRNLLRQNLHQLRAQLASTGLSTGSFDVGDRPSPKRGWESRGVAAPIRHSAGISAETNYSTPAGQSPASPVSLAAASGPLDVRL
jgi:flagellar hook-length control protein FliK